MANIPGDVSLSIMIDARECVTYVLKPGKLVNLRICSYYALKVHVVAFFDVVRIQRFAHF